MERTTQDLIASGIGERALKERDYAPDFALPDAIGRIVALRDMLERGPVILTFYRGGWCPYCNLELRAYQRLLPEIRGLGANLVAVSPQTPDRSLSTAEKNALSFPVLSDVGLLAAARFGIVFEMPPELQTLYRDFGNELPVVNGDGTWRLPVPATYVIASDGRIGTRPWILRSGCPTGTRDSGDTYENSCAWSRNTGRRSGQSWCVDETYLKIHGHWCYLYRAGDRL